MRDKTRERGSRSYWRLLTAVLLGGALIISALPFVIGGGEVSVSNAFILVEELPYWISHPLNSDFPATAAALEAEIRTQVVGE